MAGAAAESSGNHSCKLFDGREAAHDLADSVVPDRAHAGSHRRLLDLVARRSTGGQLLELVVHDQELEDADSALVARLRAPGAADLAVEACAEELAGLLGREARSEERRVGKEGGCREA